MSRALTLIYGVVSYLLFLVAFLYAIGFVGNIAVPKGIDTGEPGPFWQSVLINVLLLGLFGLQHSVMARPGFKRWWTQFVPKQIERSTFVWIASALLILMFWQWRPLPEAIWNVEGTILGTILQVGFWTGWIIVLVSTFLINHFDLFGLRQVFLYFRGQEYTPLEFQLSAFYRVTRHPLMLGFLIAFWCTPRMSTGHLLFAIVTTAYILVAIQLEERDLITFHGENYREYRKKVSMLIPLKKM